MTSAIIFDFNGVLVDDEEVHFELFRELLAEDGVAITLDDYQNRYLGYDDRGCFAAALGDNGQAFDSARLDELIARKAQRYVTVAENGLRFFPDAAETLGMLAAVWPIAICSGALRSEIEYALRRLGCRDFIASIVAAEDVHRCKPDPSGYQQALNALRRAIGNKSPVAPMLSPHQCLVVEDSLAGIMSAKAAGMWAVGITHTYTEAQLLQSGADAIVRDLQTLRPAWVKQQLSLNADADLSST
jgi:HAD superfamily hydrolase (TIGR01509 family)